MTPGATTWSGISFWTWRRIKHSFVNWRVGQPSSYSPLVLVNRRGVGWWNDPSACGVVGAAMSL